MRSLAATKGPLIMRARFGRYVVCCLAAAALAATASAQTRYTTIVIDPGHGGFDPGGIPGQRVPEKIMTLDVSLRLKPLLEKAGYRVVMTRDTDCVCSTRHARRDCQFKSQLGFCLYSFQFRHSQRS